MSGQQKTIVYSTNSRYWEHVYVSLYSLLVNNLRVGFDVRIMAEALDDRFFSHVDSLRRLHGNVEISWLPVGCNEFDGAHTSYFTKEAYYRLLLDRLLPDTIDRVLYLDGDTVVRGSLAELFDVDLMNYSVAAVPEFVPEDLWLVHQPHWKRLGFPWGSSYFNSGVLLIDLEKWRGRRVAARAREYVQSNSDFPDRLEFADQDALNGVLDDDWKPIGPHYNYTEWTIQAQRMSQFDVDGQIGGVVPNTGPVVAHFAGSRKPWQGGCTHPYAKDYWHYRMQTPYGSYMKLANVRVNDARAAIRCKAATLIRRVPGGKPALETIRSVVQRMRRDGTK